MPASKALISTALFPVLLATSAAQTPQHTVAVTEMQSMADQLVLVQAHTLWLTTLENLDDISVPSVSRPFDYINDQGGALVIDPFDGDFYDPHRLDLLNRPGGFNWQGPYMTYQPQRTDDEFSDYDEGTPLDPWGTPYYLYTPLGLVDPQNEAIVLEGYEDDFDQYTIVSYGPDGVLSGDDLTRSIGTFFVQVPVISSVRLEPMGGRRALYELRIKGYNFEPAQGSGGVLVDGVPIDGTITQWSNTLILVETDVVPSQNATFTVETDSGAAPSIVGFISEGAVGLGDWEIYS